MEVKAAEVVGGQWENVFVGQIKGVDPIPTPTASGWPCGFSTGQETVVCGAANLRIGEKIAFARVGAWLIDDTLDK